MYEMKQKYKSRSAFYKKWKRWRFWTLENEHESENLKLMTSAPVPKAILTLAIPTVFSTVISLVYNLTDTYFIGLLDDPVQLGAISLAFPVFLVFQALGNMFGAGAPSYISRCLGAGRYDEVRRTSAVSVYVSAGMMLVLTVAGLLFMEPILGVIGTSSETIGPTRDCLRLFRRYWAVLPWYCSIIWWLGMGMRWFRLTVLPLKWSRWSLWSCLVISPGMYRLLVITMELETIRGWPMPWNLPCWQERCTVRSPCVWPAWQYRISDKNPWDITAAYGRLLRTEQCCNL